MTTFIILTWWIVTMYIALCWKTCNGRGDNYRAERFKLCMNISLDKNCHVATKSKRQSLLLKPYISIVSKRIHGYGADIYHDCSNSVWVSLFVIILWKHRSEVVSRVRSLVHYAFDPACVFVAYIHIYKLKSFSYAHWDLSHLICVLIKSFNII